MTTKVATHNVLKRIEDVRKIDIRVKGRSTLEAHISDLDDEQKLQYWKEGKVTFTGDMKKEELQTWTRSSKSYINSRRNNDTIPKKLLI